MLKIPHLIPLVAVSAALLTACSSLGQITLIDKDIYMITNRATFYGISAAADGIQQAVAFCQQRGKRMEVTNSQTADAVLGMVPARSAVMFKCVD